MELGITDSGNPNWNDSGWDEQLGSALGGELPPLDGSETDDRNVSKALQNIYEYELYTRRPRERTWARSWDRFYNRWDFTRKRDWQSKRGLPVITMLALKIGWELTKSLELAGDNWFEVTTKFEPYRAALEVPKILVQKYLKLGGQYEECEFLTSFYDAVVGACISDMMHMLVMPENEGIADWTPGENPFDDAEEEEPEEGSSLDDFDLPSLGVDGPNQENEGLPTIEEMSRKFRIRYEPINPRLVLMDTTSRGGASRYKMYVQRVTPWQFREMGEKFGWDNIEEVIETATNSDSDHKSDINNSNSREKGEASVYDKYNCLTIVHFMGTLMDENGELLFKNKYCSFVNDKICQPPVDLGLWHGRLPIVSAPMIRVPWSNYHMSLVNLNLDPQEARVELLNALLDYLHQAINPVTEIDHDLIHPSYGSNHVMKGIAPGQVIHAAKMGRPNPVIARAQVPDLGGGVWQGMSFFKQEWSEGSGLADTGAMPRTRNRISASEFKERQSAASGIFQQMARNIEREFLEPTLQQSFLLALQKVPQEVWDAAVEEAIERTTGVAEEADGGADTPAEESKDVAILKSLLGMDAKTRYKKMAVVYRFETKIYSGMETRRENLEKVSIISEMASKNPAMSGRLRWQKLAEMGILALEEDPNAFLWPDRGDTQERPFAGQPPDGGLSGQASGVPPRPPGQENV